MLGAADGNQGGASRWSCLRHEAWDDCSPVGPALGECPTEWALPLRCDCWLFPTPLAQFRQGGCHDYQSLRLLPCLTPCRRKKSFISCWTFGLVVTSVITHRFRIGSAPSCRI